MKLFFMTALLLAATILSGSFSASAQTAADTTKTTTQILKTIRIKVTGITCKGDCRDIQQSVSKLGGINGTKQIGKPAATSIFEIIFDPAIVNETAIYKSVEDTPGCDDPEKRPYKVKKEH